MICYLLFSVILICARPCERFDFDFVITFTVFMRLCSVEIVNIICRVRCFERNNIRSLFQFNFSTYSFEGVDSIVIVYTGLTALFGESSKYLVLNTY